MTFTNSSDPSIESPALPIEKMPVTVDSKGRLRASKEQRRVILAEFERRRMSAAQFAKVAGLKYSTFAAWVQRYRRARPKRAPQPMRLLEAVVPPAPVAGGKPLALMVELPGGARLEIGQVEQVPLAAALLDSLHRPC
jgi:hypothetical protein